jgi:hypothetical protein
MLERDIEMVYVGDSHTLESSLVVFFVRTDFFDSPSSNF